MGRFIAPGNVPNDRGFAARTADDPLRDADDVAYAAATIPDPMAATNVEKIVYYEAKAQVMANQNNCAVLCHWHVLPHFQNTPPTLTAALIPSIEPADEPA